MAAPFIMLTWDGGGFELDSYWCWVVDNGQGLRVNGNSNSAVRATKQALKALAKIQGIQSEIHQEVEFNEFL